MAAARPAVVGGFVLGAIALAVAGILFFGGTQYFASTTQAVVYFEGSVAGLEVGSPVTFRGVHVGSVQGMTLEISPEGLAHIPVVINLLPGQVKISPGSANNGEISVKSLVKAGLRAQLMLQSVVTGQLRIDLDFQPHTKGRLVASNVDDLPQIPALPSDLERLRATLSEIPVADLAKTASRVMTEVQHLTQRLDQAMGPLLDNSQESLKAATRTLNTTNESVIRLRDEATKTLAALTALANTAQQQLSGSGPDLDRLLKSAQHATEQADTLLTQLKTMTAPRSNIRGNLDSAARDLAASASSLRSFSRTIEQNPSTLLRGRSQR